MSIATLIQKFSALEKVPVDVNDVIAELRTRGIVDEVYFFEPELNSYRLKGQLVHYEKWDYPASENGPIVRCADIYYARDLPRDWQRLVSCKEVLHILDPSGCLARTEDEVKTLFEKISLPPDMQDPLNDGGAVNSDRVALFQAVAILFPYTVRNLLMPHFPGTFTVQDIARMVDLPPRFVSFVMSSSWEVMHRILSED